MKQTIMKGILLTIMIVFAYPINAQMQLGMAPHKDRKAPFQGEKRKINDIIHTKIKANAFHLEKHFMEGEVWIDLQPHFYPTDSLTLDAKSMVLNTVKVNGTSVKYDYDGKKIKIRLPKVFQKNEKYTVYINYIAQPDKNILKKKGLPISDSKGLYFIDGNDNYPTHFWTQGETEANSGWFPTIDSPNQKSTEEIYMTIPQEWVSLSNGNLINSTKNSDGTKTDYWKQTKPHAPYLFFMAAGPFSVVKDKYKDIEVNYYVEKKYEDVARDIFGKTPKMIQYFSDLTGVPYEWDKYNQIVVRQFVSGAMENTTCVNHSDMAYQEKGDLVDENSWETVIAHELFHHWFGDLVTTESWSNITVNESFADYGESLWEEFDEGMDKADYIRSTQKQTYMMIPGNDQKELVRYHYNDEMEVFDAVSYQKGGLILHMLRDLVGDKAFFAGMKKYLLVNKFKTGEAEQFRLALEEVSGMDLTRFFQQWYYQAGHPVLDITYEYNDTDGTAKVNIEQKTEKTWEFPLSIDVYQNGKYKRYNVKVTKKESSFSFPYEKHPDLINVGAKQILLAKITDHKSLNNKYFQFKNAKNYTDRKIGLKAAIAHKDEKDGFKILIMALDDSFYILRKKALKNIDIKSEFFNKKIEKKLYYIANNDASTIVKAEAIKKLSKIKKKKYLKIFEKGVASESNTIKKASFGALSKNNKQKAIAILNKMDEKSIIQFGYPVVELFYNSKDESKQVLIAKIIYGNVMSMFQNQKKQKYYTKVLDWIVKGNNVEGNKTVADGIKKMADDYGQYGLKNMAKFMIKGNIQKQKATNNSHKKEIVDYYNKVLSSLNK